MTPFNDDSRGYRDGLAKMGWIVGVNQTTTPARMNVTGLLIF